MYCRKCGKEIKEGEIFCSKCGTKIINEEKTNNSYYNSTTDETQTKTQDTNNNSYPKYPKFLKVFLILLSIFVIYKISILILYPDLTKDEIRNAKDIQEVVNIDRKDAITFTEIISDVNIGRFSNLYKITDWEKGERYEFTYASSDYWMYLNGDKTLNSINILPSNDKLYDCNAKVTKKNNASNKDSNSSNSIDVKILNNELEEDEYGLYKFYIDLELTNNTDEKEDYFLLMDFNATQNNEVVPFLPVDDNGELIEEDIKIKPSETKKIKLGCDLVDNLAPVNIVIKENALSGNGKEVLRQTFSF